MKYISLKDELKKSSDEFLKGNILLYEVTPGFTPSTFHVRKLQEFNPNLFSPIEPEKKASHPLTEYNTEPETINDEYFKLTKQLWNLI